MQGSVVVIRRLPNISPITLNAVGMATGALVLLGFSILFGEVRELPTLTETWVALAYLVIIGSVVVFLLHVFVAQNWNASSAAYIMVTTPLIAILHSSWLDNEPVTSALLWGGTLVLAGVYIGALRESQHSYPAVDD